MTYGKVYKALELCCKYMRVLTMEIMTGLVPKGTGKNNINHLQIKTFPSKYEQTVFWMCSELVIRPNILSYH